MKQNRMKITDIKHDANAPGVGMALTLVSARGRIEVRVSENSEALVRGIINVLTRTVWFGMGEQWSNFVERILGREVLVKWTSERVLVGDLSGKQYFIVTTKISEGWSLPKPIQSDEDLDELYPPIAVKEDCDCGDEGAQALYDRTVEKSLVQAL